MKRYILLSLICFGVSSGQALACAGSPDSLFGRASYIDPDYVAPDYSYVTYGLHEKFQQISQNYINVEVAPKTVDDQNARAMSAVQEPSAYTNYLAAAEKFRAMDYDGALKLFTQLKDPKTSFKERFRRWFGRVDYSWVKEASTYMVARCQLIIAQNNWDGYSDPVAAVDQKILKLADASYQHYLTEYPQGLYADSARHISRKIFYLAGN